MYEFTDSNPSLIIDFLRLCLNREWRSGLNWVHWVHPQLHHFPPPATNIQPIHRTTALIYSLIFVLALIFIFLFDVTQAHSMNDWRWQYGGVWSHSFGSRNWKVSPSSVYPWVPVNMYKLNTKRAFIEEVKNCPQIYLSTNVLSLRYTGKRVPPHPPCSRTAGTDECVL